MSQIYLAHRRGNTWKSKGGSTGAILRNIDSNEIIFQTITTKLIDFLVVYILALQGPEHHSEIYGTYIKKN